MSDIDPAASRQQAGPPRRSGLSSGTVRGIGPFQGGPFNIGWVPIAVGILAVVGGLIFFINRNRTAAGATSPQTTQQQMSAAQQAAAQQQGAAGQATMVPLPYPVDWAGQPQQPGSPTGTPIQYSPQPTQPAASSLGSVTLVGQPTGGQQATQAGPPFLDPTTGQVLSSAAGPYFQWGQTLQAAGPPNQAGVVPVIGPTGGIVGIPNVDIQSWNNPSASSLSSMSPAQSGSQGQITA